MHAFHCMHKLCECILNIHCFRLVNKNHTYYYFFQLTPSAFQLSDIYPPITITPRRLSFTPPSKLTSGSCDGTTEVKKPFRLDVAFLVGETTSEIVSRILEAEEGKPTISYKHMSYYINVFKTSLPHTATYVYSVVFYKHAPYYINVACFQNCITTYCNLCVYIVVFYF